MIKAKTNELYLSLFSLLFSPSTGKQNCAKSLHKWNCSKQFLEIERGHMKSQKQVSVDTEIIYGKIITHQQKNLS